MRLRVALTALTTLAARAGQAPAKQAPVPAPAPAAALPAPAPAMISTLTPAQFKALVGPMMKVTKEAAEEKVTYLVFEFDNMKLAVYFYEPQESGGFANIQLFGSYRKTDATTPELIAAWNRTRRFSRAYLDSKGIPCLESDLDLTGGVGEENVREFLRTFCQLMRMYSRTLKDGK